MKGEGLWVQQRLIVLSSMNHHLSGLSMSFVIKITQKRLGKLRSDFIAMMSDRVSANGVTQKDMISNEDN